MANLVKKIRTSSGDLQIDYNALANLPMINNNMLINGDFKINQRGSTNYIQTNTWKYSVDRWRYIGLMNVTVNNSGTVTISKSNNNDQTYFAQALEDVYTSGSFVFSFCIKSISGTLSAYIDSGGGSVLTVTSPGTYSVSAPTGAKAVVFRLDGSTTSVELSWAKLEQGSVATPFIPRLRGEELALCQRYFCIMGGTRVSGIEEDKTANTFTYAIPRNCEMMKSPSISIHGTTTTNSTDGICVRTIGCLLLPGFTFSYSVRNWDLLIVAKSSSALTNSCFETQLYINDAFKIYLDAEIY